MRFRLKPVVFTLLCVLAHAAAAEQPRAQDKPAAQQEEPVRLEADSLTGQKEDQIEASGDAILTKSDQRIRADRVTYDQQSKDAEGFGSVVLDQAGTTMSGPHIKMNMDTHAGLMEKPQFYLKDTDGRGSGDMLRMQDKQHFELDNASYTTCPAGDQDWFVKTGSLEIDRVEQVGVAQHAWVEFMDVPILYSPWMDFPLGRQRKSGFLAPTFGGSTKGGSELTLPYYWNIAPNYDATIAPRMMMKRGVLFNNEFRYVQSDYGGELHADLLPNDSLTGTNRGRFGLKHNQVFGSGFSGNLDFNRVSDNAYYRDLADAMNVATQLNLVQDARLNYSEDWWNGSVRLQRFQTLQDPLAPVAVPYARLPQLTLNGKRSFGDANVSFVGEYVSFSHPTALNGQRLVFAPSVSYPLINTPSLYATPKFTLHSTQYVMGSNNAAGLPDVTRTLPMFSMDSGLAFERDFDLLGKSYLNTLEPRAYYVYVPYRKQDQLPVYDTAQSQFSFAQMFTENRFIGNDRIGDANQVTLAVISRFLAQDTGAEYLKLMVGERFSFTPPQVNLVAPSTTTNKSDILLGATGHLYGAWSFDSELQYSPALSTVQHYNLMARYRPESGKVFNLGYRFIANSLGTLIPGAITPTGTAVVNGVIYPTIWGVPYTTIGGNNYSVASPALRQINVSGQWPLSNHWHAVGQLNYSFLDGLLLNGIAGLEYQESCWTLRVVAQSFTVGTLLTAAGITPQNNTGFYVQLELNDLVKVGSDPLMLLKQNVPGYTKVKPESSQVLR